MPPKELELYTSWLQIRTRSSLGSTSSVYGLDFRGFRTVDACVAQEKPVEWLKLVPKTVWGVVISLR